MLVWINENNKITATYDITEEEAQNLLKDGVQWIDEVIEIPEHDAETQTYEMYLLEDGTINYVISDIEETETVTQPTNAEIQENQLVIMDAIATLFETIIEV